MIRKTQNLQRKTNMITLVGKKDTSTPLSSPRQLDNNMAVMPIRLAKIILMKEGRKYY